MPRSITSAVQWGILVLSSALLVAAAHAQTSGEPDAEEPVAQTETQSQNIGPHRIRVGLAPVKAQMTAQTTPPGANLEEPLRGLLMSQLTGPVEVIPLTESVPEKVEAEASEKECDYVLYTSITRQANGKIGFLHGALQMPIPMVGAGRGMVGTPASVTAGTLLSGAGEAARVVKTNDAISLEYRLISQETIALVLAGTLHVRANEDGQDVVAPLVEQEASSVLNVIRQKATVH